MGARARFTLHRYALFTCIVHLFANQLEQNETPAWIRITYTIYSVAVHFVCHAYRWTCTQSAVQIDNAEPVSQNEIEFTQTTNMHIRYHIYTVGGIWIR